MLVHPGRHIIFIELTTGDAYGQIEQLLFSSIKHVTIHFSKPQS